jgi:NitT/TauT family transport system substrate-binding protein
MLFRNVTSRRTFLAASTAAASLPLFSSSSVRAAGAKRQVSMRLDYPYQGASIGFVVAREKGFYDEVDMDVDVGPGKGGSITAQLVASKAVDFGFSDGFVVGTGVSKGMNIRMVAAIYRRNPAALIVLDNSTIKTPKDLEGRTIGMPAGGGTFQQWPAYAKGCGFDANKVHVVNLDPAGNIPALLTGRVDAIAAFPMTAVPDIELRGKTTAREMWHADCGVKIVGNGIIVHNDLIKNEPVFIRAFVAASLKGFLYGRAHPDEAGAMVKKYLPSIDPQAANRQVELSWETWVTPNTKGKPLGWMSSDDWQATVDLLAQINANDPPARVDQLFTNDFIPMGAEFIPPQI